MLFFTHFSVVGGYETERVTLNMVWNRFCNSKGDIAAISDLIFLMNT